jgi:hypothetical protein
VALVSARFATPEFIQRAAENVVQLPVHLDGKLTPVTSGTLTVTDEGGNTIVDAQSVSITSQIATYTLSAGVLPDTLPLSTDWLEEWKLTVEGTEHTFRREAYLVLRKLYPVLTEPDLLRRHNSLDRLRPANLANYGTYLQEAWDEIQIRLLEGGRRPQLIMSPWSLRQVHIDKTLEIIYRDFMTLAGDGNYAKLAEFYGEQFEANWNKLVLTYDYDEEGSPGDAEEGVAVEPVTYLTAGPSGLSTYVPGDLY